MNKSCFSYCISKTSLVPGMDQTAPSREGRLDARLLFWPNTNDLFVVAKLSYFSNYHSGRLYQTFKNCGVKLTNEVVLGKEFIQRVAPVGERVSSYSHWFFYCGAPWVWGSLDWGLKASTASSYLVITSSSGMSLMVNTLGF